MLTGKLIHPDIAAALAYCGHGDKILLTDANYPMDSKAAALTEKIYLGLRRGCPTVTDVLETILSAVNVEKAEVMDPGDGSEPEVFAEFRKLLGGMELNGLGRFEFYDAACEDAVRVAVWTGEQRLWSNILLTVGTA